MQTSPFLGELIGTMVLLLLGNGVVANVVLKQTKGESGGWIVITAGWAFAVMMGVFVSKAFGSVDAHLNPAVTVAFAVAQNDYSHLIPYIIAQLIGGFLGATLVWLHTCRTGPPRPTRPINWLVLGRVQPFAAKGPTYLVKFWQRSS
jgi:glycerol uptake facilitator protein